MKKYTQDIKTILGLKKTSSNISQVLMYFVRINSNNINPLIKESLNVNKKMHDEGKYSWYAYLNNIFKEFDLDIEDYSNIQMQINHFID